MRAFDPVAAEPLKAALPAVTTTDDMYAVLSGADALVICTEWSEFRHPDFERVASALRQKVIFDGRNIFRCELMRELGFVYYSVGREPVQAADAGLSPLPLGERGGEAAG